MAILAWVPFSSYRISCSLDTGCVNMLKGLGLFDFNFLIVIVCPSLCFTVSLQACMNSCTCKHACFLVPIIPVCVMTAGLAHVCFIACTCSCLGYVPDTPRVVKSTPPPSRCPWACLSPDISHTLPPPADPRLPPVRAATGMPELAVRQTRP